MKIAVIAANGRSGREFVKKALAAGYQVKAGVFSTRIPEAKNLEVVTCNATDVEQMRGLIHGCDAVVSFIGHVKGSPATVQTDAIKNAVEAMKKENIKRIISLTGTGVRLPDDSPNLADKLINTLVTITDPDRVKDGIMHAKVLKESGLDWTIIRVLKLQNSKPKPFVLRMHGPAKLITSRSEVADAVLVALADPNMVKQAPVVSNP